MPDDKVTFAAAARALGVHVNSVKNWNTAGKLATAEKIQVKDVDKWVVSLTEARQLQQAGHTSIHNNIDNNQVYNGSTTDTQQLVVQPNADQQQQAWVTYKLLESQASRIEELIRDKTNLERDKQELQARLDLLEASQAVQIGAQSPVATEPIQHTQQPLQQPTKRPSLWQRMFGERR